MRKIFNNPEYQAHFVQHGYVIVPFLDESEIQTLQKVHDELPKPAMDETFYTSHWSRNEEYRRMVHAAVDPHIRKKSLDLLHEYRPSYSYFMVKFPSEKSEVTLHQDWSMLDEDQHTGITFWCPLVDTTLENGSFHIVKNSHRFPKVKRGTGIEPHYENIARYVEANYLTEVPVKAGQAVLFDQNLLHYSPPNRSQATRVVVGHVSVPKEAKFTHYYLDPAHSKEQYQVYEGDEEFLLKFAFGDDPDTMLERVGEHPTNTAMPDEPAFDALFQQYNPQPAEKSAGLLGNLKKMISNAFKK